MLDVHKIKNGSRLTNLMDESKYKSFSSDIGVFLHKKIIEDPIKLDSMVKVLRIRPRIINEKHEISERFREKVY